jgi:PAS domain-containing protein
MSDVHRPGEDALHHQMMRPDGEVRWVRSTRRFAAGIGGLPGGMVGVLDDITERRRNEEELKAAKEMAEAAEQRFRTLCEQMPVGVFQKPTSAETRSTPIPDARRFPDSA